MKYSEFESPKALADYFHLVGEMVNGEAHYIKQPVTPVYLNLEVGESGSLHIHVGDSIYDTTHANLDIIDKVTLITNQLAKLEVEVSEYGTPLDISFTKLTGGQYRVSIDVEFDSEGEELKNIFIDGLTPDDTLAKLSNLSGLLGA